MMDHQYFGYQKESMKINQCVIIFQVDILNQEHQDDKHLFKKQEKKHQYYNIRMIIHLNLHKDSQNKKKQEIKESESYLYIHHIQIKNQLHQLKNEKIYHNGNYLLYKKYSNIKQ